MRRLANGGFTTSTTLAEMINKFPMKKKKKCQKKKKKKRSKDKKTGVPKKYLSGLKGSKTNTKS